GLERGVHFIGLVHQRERGIGRNDEKTGRFVTERNARVSDREAVERASAGGTVVQDIAYLLQEIVFVSLRTETQSNRSVLRAHTGKLHADQAEAFEIEVTLDQRGCVEIEVGLGCLG